MPAEKFTFQTADSLTAVADLIARTAEELRGRADTMREAGIPEIEVGSGGYLDMLKTSSVKVLNAVREKLEAALDEAGKYGRPAKGSRKKSAKKKAANK